MSNHQLPKVLSTLIARVLKNVDFAFISNLARRFPKAQIYLVGGIVRDALLNRESKDYDFVICGVAHKELENFLNDYGRVDYVGRVFGVYKFLPKSSKMEEPLDIALPRKEQAWGTGGYRDVQTQSDPFLPIEDDLSRRDFTINAMALRIEGLGLRGLPRAKSRVQGSGLLIDPFGGMKDVKNKTIRAVGDPRARFKEDYSRMLRGLRFASELNFTFEPETWRAINELMPKISEKRMPFDKARGEEGGEKEELVVPMETVAKELVKAFTANPPKAFDLFYESGATVALMPELLAMRGCPQPKNFHAEGDVWTHTRLALTILKSPAYRRAFGNEPPEADLALAVLFHDIAKPVTIQTPETHGVDRIRFNEHDTIGADMARKIIERLRLSAAPGFNVSADRVHWLILHHLILVHGAAEIMKASTVEKYFFNPVWPSDNLLKLIFADGSATIFEESGKAELNHFKAIKKRIAELKRGPKKKTLPLPLLNGLDVMGELKIKPGPRVGEVLTLLREAQLEKKIKTRAEAFKMLKGFEV